MIDQKYVYHASKIRGLKVLEPKPSTHKMAWIYATKDIAITAMYLGKNSDFICQTGILKGKPYIWERFKGAFDLGYKNKKGSIYYLKPDTFKEGITSFTSEVVSKDGSMFLVTQYIGVLCGILGLGFTSLGFFFSEGWSVEIHTVLTSVILLLPYIVSGGFWLVAKVKEKENRLYDEKQIQDMGRSALLSLPLSIVCMISLFVLDFWVLDIGFDFIWLPVYLFFNLMVFSLGTLYFSTRE